MELGFGLALAAFAALAAAIALWVQRMQAVALGGRRGSLFALCALAAVLGGLALANEPGWIGGAFASVGVLGGVVWLGLGALAGQSAQTPAIAVGQPIVAFGAPDHEGVRFEIESLRGHPVLIKLFRGHW